MGSPGPLHCGDPEGWVGRSPWDGAAWVAERRPGANSEALVLPPPAGRSRPSKWHSAAPSGASVAPGVAAAGLAAGSGTRWRPRLEVEFRGLVRGDPPEGLAEELLVWPCAGDGCGGTSNRRSAFPGRRFESSRGRLSSGGSALGVRADPSGLTPSPTQPTSLLFTWGLPDPAPNSLILIF